MVKYAIIKSGGKQYKVVEGGFVEVDKIDLEEGKDFAFEDVLLVSSDGVAKIGQPQVKGATVSGKIVAQVKGDKIRVAKFKAKARYRRVQGFRAQLTRVKIEKINS